MNYEIRRGEVGGKGGERRHILHEKAEGRICRNGVNDKEEGREEKWKDDEGKSRSAKVVVLLG